MIFHLWIFSGVFPIISFSNPKEKQFTVMCFVTWMKWEMKVVSNRTHKMKKDTRAFPSFKLMPTGPLNIAPWPLAIPYEPRWIRNKWLMNVLV